MIVCVIDGKQFSDLEGFYDEYKRKLVPHCPWVGKSLNAFNDVLRGGYIGDGTINEFVLVWKNADKSKKDLNYALEPGGSSVYDEILEIIKDNPHVTFILEKREGKSDLAEYDPDMK